MSAPGARRRQPNGNRTPTTHRVARVKEWNANKQHDRTVRTEQIPFHGSVAQLIRHASALVPQWAPLQVNLFVGTDPPKLEVGFGHDAEGTSTHVYVQLKPGDLAATLSYMARLEVKAGMMCATYPEDDDGGEELPVPTVSEAELAEMAMPSATLQ